MTHWLTGWLDKQLYGVACYCQFGKLSLCTMAHLQAEWSIANDFGVCLTFKLGHHFNWSPQYEATLLFTLRI